jgi:hypothetical protein
MYPLCSNLPMRGKSESGRPRGRVTAAAKAAVVDALAGGGRLRDVAAAHGVTTQALYKARKRDPVFDAGWRAAHAASAEAERRARREAGVDAPQAVLGSLVAEGRWAPDQVRGDRREGEERIVSNNRRVLQRRKLRHVRFDTRRRAVFLTHFRWSCDAVAAAEAAGVCERTVYYHLQRDGAFAGEFQAALEESYVLLEAETVRRRIEAQAQLRAAIEAYEAGQGPFPSAATESEFERTMKLLARWDRRHDGRLGMQVKRPSASRRWTFEEAIALLDRNLRALGVRSTDPAPPGARSGEN